MKTSHPYYTQCANDKIPQCNISNNHTTNIRSRYNSVYRVEILIYSLMVDQVMHAQAYSTNKRKYAVDISSPIIICTQRRPQLPHPIIHFAKHHSQSAICVDNTQHSSPMPTIIQNSISAITSDCISINNLPLWEKINKVRKW